MYLFFELKKITIYRTARVRLIGSWLYTSASIFGEHDNIIHNWYSPMPQLNTQFRSRYRHRTYAPTCGLCVWWIIKTIRHTQQTATIIIIARHAHMCRISRMVRHSIALRQQLLGFNVVTHTVTFKHALKRTIACQSKDTGGHRTMEHVFPNHINLICCTQVSLVGELCIDWHACYVAVASLCYS